MTNPTESAERPIIFQADMVRAILEGRKTQTRRIVKPQPLEQVPAHLMWKFNARPDERPEMLKPTYGVPGDRLWVRETLRISERTRRGIPGNHLCSYAATHVPVQIADTDDKRAWVQARIDSHCERARDGIGEAFCRVPSIHMPRWASRIDLEVKAVRVGRLQDVSEADAKAEGAVYGEASTVATMYGAAEAFRQLWNLINGPDAWDANPWVWVIEFERVKP